jgi:hypothetical protein
LKGKFVEVTARKGGSPGTEISVGYPDSVAVDGSDAPGEKANQTPGFSNRFSMILISDLLTVFPSFKWHNLISLTIILSSTHPNPSLSKNMIVSLSISLLTSVSKPLLLSKQQYFCSRKLPKKFKNYPI